MYPLPQCRQEVSGLNPSRRGCRGALVEHGLVVVVTLQQRASQVSRVHTQVAADGGWRGGGNGAARGCFAGGHIHHRQVPQQLLLFLVKIRLAAAAAADAAVVGDGVGGGGGGGGGGGVGGGAPELTAGAAAAAAAAVAVMEGEGHTDGQRKLADDKSAAAGGGEGGGGEEEGEEGEEEEGEEGEEEEGEVPMRCAMCLRWYCCEAHYEDGHTHCRGRKLIHDDRVGVKTIDQALAQNLCISVTGESPLDYLESIAVDRDILLPVTKGP